MECFSSYIGFIYGVKCLTRYHLWSLPLRVGGGQPTGDIHFILPHAGLPTFQKPFPISFELVARMRDQMIAVLMN